MPPMLSEFFTRTVNWSLPFRSAGGRETLNGVRSPEPRYDWNGSKVHMPNVIGILGSDDTGRFRRDGITIFYYWRRLPAKTRPPSSLAAFHAASVEPLPECLSHVKR